MLRNGIYKHHTIKIMLTLSGRGQDFAQEVGTFSPTNWSAKEEGSYSLGDFVLILKNFLLLLERMRFAKIQNVFQNNSA